MDGDANKIAELLELATRQLERAEVPEYKVVLSARRLKLVAAGDKLFAESGRILDDLLGVRLPCWLCSLKEGSRDTGNGVVVWATLARRENCLINPLLEI